MFLILGALLSCFAFFVTKEGTQSVIQIMLCAFFLNFIFGKKPDKGDNETSSLSDYLYIKYGNFRASPKKNKKLTQEEKEEQNKKLNKWNGILNDLESDYWLESVKSHLRELNERKGMHSEPNYSMMYYQEVRKKLLDDARGNIFLINIRLNKKP